MGRTDLAQPNRARHTVAAGISTLLALHCTASPPAMPREAPASTATPASGTASAGPEPDVCLGKPPLPVNYEGLLQAARCEQEKYLTMAGVAYQLGVECRHCHARSAADPTKEDYPQPTPKKEVANWMRNHLMMAVKPADGSKLRCKSCHTDPTTGKPVAKILGDPRDHDKAQEWMTMVMVNKFVTVRGEKLKCKSCHLENFSKPGFQAKVILQTAQLPPH